MTAANWGMLQSLWNNALGWTFGSNTVLITGFFLFFFGYLLFRLGVGMELAIPATIVFVFLLVGTSGLQPTWIYTVLLVVVGYIVYVAFARFINRN